MSRMTITNNNLSPLLDVFIWFCLVFSILTVIVRLVIKLKVLRKVGLDDYLIVTSLIFALAQSIAISIATANGLGRPLDSLNDLQISSQLKASYAASFLFITCICLAKLSFVAFLRSLTPVAIHRKLGWSIGTIVLLWATTAVLAFAFQCKLPRAWDYQNNACFNRKAWENYVAIVNVLTDVGLIVLPIFIVMSLKITLGKKLAVLTAFISRLGVIAAVICQIIFLNKIGPSSDLSLDIWPVTLCMQLAQCLEILAACTVYLKPFLDSLESGFIQVGDLRRQRSEGYGYSYRGKDLVNTLSSIRGKFSKERSTPQNIQLREARKGHGISSNQIEITINDNGQTEAGDWDANSRSKILQTRTWAVHKSH